jgi:broad specificity phosphatase PhoE
MIYFIRHGESEANAIGLFAGQKDDSVLTLKGRDQAKETGEHVRSLQIFIDRVVSSSLKRALETAQIIASELGFDKSKISIDDRITEYDMGELTGTPFKHISSKALVDAPNAEDPQQFLHRTVEAVKEYQKMTGNTLLVSHAGVGRVLESVKEGMPPELFYDLKAFANASVTLIDWIK